MSRARVVRTLYRNLLRQARRADADVILRHQISKQPVDVLQVASAGLGRSCRSINVQINGQRGRIPRLHAIYDRDVAPADFAAAATATPATPEKVWMSTVDKSTGRTYYYDALTRETTWAKPAGEIRESTGDDSAIVKNLLLPKLASVPVVAQHADYGDNVFYDGAATSAGPDGVFVNFDDGDVYGWTGEDAGAKVRRKVLVREETPEPGTKLLVVAAHYGRGPMRYHKWVRAEAVAPAADEKPAAWTLTSFCRHAFRHPEALEGYAVGMDATPSANAGPSANNANAGPSANDALTEALDAFTAERAQLDKGFEVLKAVNDAAGRVERYGASEADDVQKPPRLGSEPLQLPTFDERTSLIAANAAYYSAVRRKDADLMEQLLDDDCTMGNSHNYTRGKEQNARDFRNYCENPTPPKYPYLVEIDDVQVFLDSENVGRVVVTERNTADWCASSDDYRPSQSPVTIAREVNVNTFARTAPGQPWKLRQRQETRVDFETNARSDQAQA
jgi:hypothetical protein